MPKVQRFRCVVTYPVVEDGDFNISELTTEYQLIEEREILPETQTLYLGESFWYRIIPSCEGDRLTNITIILENSAIEINPAPNLSSLELRDVSIKISPAPCTFDNVTIGQSVYGDLCITGGFRLVMEGAPEVIIFGRSYVGEYFSLFYPSYQSFDALEDYNNQENDPIGAVELAAETSAVAEDTALFHEITNLLGFEDISHYL